MGRRASRAWVIAGIGLGLLPVQAAADGLRVDGRGPPVILELGTGEPPASWDAVVAGLRNCLTIVRYDRREMAGSRQTGGGLPALLASDVATRLHALLRRNGIVAPYLLVGHSIGGLYVQAFARHDPNDTAGVVLVDASSPLEPKGVFVSTVPPAAGSHEAAEDNGFEPSVDALLNGPPFPPVPLAVLVADDHAQTQEREALWQDVQRRTAALSPRGRMTLVASGHDIQRERPAAVVDSILAVAAEAGWDVSGCR